MCPKHEHARKERNQTYHFIVSVWRRAKNKCEKCAAQLEIDVVIGHVDHIIPISHGGKSEMENLQLLCVPCHEKKSRMDKKSFKKRPLGV